MNTLKKLIFSTFVITIFQFNLIGQSNNDTILNGVSKHSIGLGAGFSTGYGLSYRYVPNKIGFQINFAPYTKEEQQVYSTGLTFIYRLKQGEFTNLFLYQGNHYFYNRMVNTYSYTGEQVKIKEAWINGIGFGIEFNLNYMSFNLMAGFANYTNFGGINLTGESGLYFKF